METEKWQDGDDSRGIDVTASDPPITPPPANLPSNSRMDIHPHR